ncbi:hypothetical protein ACFCX0_03520 [Streptomyces sp. NPDC056352]|uniref:hypothetical protein n=1 Tax=Streptomyces sp. NPDC056352 TaxID=3345791 RepID=UPI0035D727F9
MTENLAHRVNAVHRYGAPIPPEVRVAATALLADMLAAAEKHGVSLADFDDAIDLPGGCLDVAVAAERRRRG